MNVIETHAEGLSRTFKVIVPATELLAKLDGRIEEIRPQMNIKGFRPGKVPVAHVKKMYGKSIMSDLIDSMVAEANQKALTEADIRPASQPDIQMEGDISKVLEGKADLAYSLNIDIMPTFDPADIKTLNIIRPVAPVTEADVQEALQKLAEQNQQYKPRAKTAKAKDGDAVVIDFVGKIDGEAFEGGTAEEQTVVIGAGRFIPGFEEQLIGVKSGDEIELNVTFPEEYQDEDLKGKPAVFEVKVREVRMPKKAEINEEFAKNFGLESLVQLREMMTTQIKNGHDTASRQKAKRALLDVLDEAHSFELPQKMVEQEFKQIWSQLQHEKEAGNLDSEDSKKTDEELENEYRGISQRRVRLGLVLAEIGRLADIQITDQEVQQAVMTEARKFPGQEREVFEFFQKNSGALAQVRAPIYEEKVVDHILEVAKVEDKEVSKEELFAEIED